MNIEKDQSPEEAAFLKALGQEIVNLRGTESQKKFAERAGIDRTYLLRAERGRNVGILHLKRICDAAGVSLPTLLKFHNGGREKV